MFTAGRHRDTSPRATAHNRSTGGSGPAALRATRLAPGSPVAETLSETRHGGCLRSCRSSIEVLLAAVIVACGGPPGGESDGAICQYELVFDSDRDGGTEVYALDLETGETVQVTQRTAPDVYSRLPDWSPDGRQIAFVSNQEGGAEGVYVMKSDGSDVRRLTSSHTGVENPAWSPSGDAIAFVADRDGSWGIFLAGLDGARARAIGPTPSLHPSWSPDGEWIAFIGAGAPEYDAYRMRVDGTEVTPVTRTPDLDEASVAWSPDGQYIALDAVSRTNFDLYVVSVPGSERRRLTDLDAVDARPEWSPDGGRLVFHSTRDWGSAAGSEEWLDFELYVLDLADGAVTRLTKNRAFDAHPDWCPAGPAQQSGFR